MQRFRDPKFARLYRTIRSNSGQGLVEMVISLTMLTIAVGSLIAVMVAGAIALQRTDQKGTALTLADKQLELYRTFAYPNIRLVTPLPGAGTAYFKAHSTDPSIPAATACTTGAFASCLVVGGVNGELACSSGVPACAPTQTVTGPDHRTYEIDSYITYYTAPASGAQPAGAAHGSKQVLVVVRDPTRAGAPVLARSSSTFQPLTAATS